LKRVKRNQRQRGDGVEERKGKGNREVERKRAI